MWKLRQRTVSCLSRDTGLVSGRRCQLRELVLFAVVLHCRHKMRPLVPLWQHYKAFFSNHATGATPLCPACRVIRSPQGRASPHYTGTGPKERRAYPSPGIPPAATLTPQHLRHAGHKQGSLQQHPQPKHWSQDFMPARCHPDSSAQYGWGRELARGTGPLICSA